MRSSAALLALALAPAPTAGERAARGEALFGRVCAGCHAPDRLRGKGARVERDLSRVDRAMRPVGLLSSEQVADLAAYLDREREHDEGDRR